MITRSYLSPKTKIAKSKISGLGLFVTKHIAKNEIVSIKSGHIVDTKTLERLSKVTGNSELQIEDDFFLAPLTKKEKSATMMYLNHSCEPNIGLEGNIVFVAMRDVKAGEELTMDYAIFDVANRYEMVCNCQTKRCRKIIKGGDWKKLILQKRYKGYFSTFIQRKIDGLKSIG